MSIDHNPDPHLTDPSPVYTLWTRPDLVPAIATHQDVIPVLVRGADLMIPGVVHHPPQLRQGQLVTITAGSDGPPLAVGRMAIDIDGRIPSPSGKAVHVLHTWKDALFDYGSKREPPVPATPPPASVPVEEEEDKTPHELNPSPSSSLAPTEISDLLRTALVHAIATTLPSSAFPMPSTVLYSTHILPARPSTTARSSTPVDVKHSAHKSLSAFLRVCEKEGLLKLKETKQDLVVVAVFPDHPAVLAHTRHESLRDVEARRERNEAREEAERTRVREMLVTELWKPHLHTLPFFAQTGNRSVALRPLPETRTHHVR